MGLSSCCQWPAVEQQGKVHAPPVLLAAQQPLPAQPARRGLHVSPPLPTFTCCAVPCHAVLALARCALQGLVEACLSDSPEQRPTFDGITQTLARLVEELDAEPAAASA